MDVNVFPMCQVRASSSSLLMGTAGPFNSELPISVGTAGPQLRAPDLIGHGPCRTSTARARPQLQAPDLSWRCRTSTISVGTAGPRLRAPDLSGPCRISTASSGSQLARWTSTASAGSRWALTEPASSISQWALHRTSTATRSQRALPDFNCELQIGGTAGRARDFSLPCKLQISQLPHFNRERQISAC